MKLKISDILPYAVIAIGIIIGIVGLWKWNQRRSEVYVSGRAAPGIYAEIVPSFYCQGRATLRGHLEIAAGGELDLFTTDPLDCSETKARVSDIPQVSFDEQLVSVQKSIFQKFPKLPDLQTSNFDSVQVWCRTPEGHDPNLEITTVQHVDAFTVRLQKAQASGERLRVESALELPADVKTEGDEKSVVADGIVLRIKSGKGVAEINKDDSKISVNLNCLQASDALHRCPADYALKGEDCIEQKPNAPVASRANAVDACAKRGAGFALVSRDQAPANEWTREMGFTPDPQTPAPFRCTFREVALKTETIYPDDLRPTDQSPAGQPLEVGVKFHSNKSGFVKAIRFFRNERDPAGYTVHLWDADGHALATTSGQPTGGQSTGGQPASTQPASEIGWQTINLAEPVAIRANIVYTASYYAAGGRVPERKPALQVETGRGLSLSALAKGGVSITNGGFPSQIAPDTDFMVDVTFEPVQ